MGMADTLEGSSRDIPRETDLRGVEAEDMSDELVLDRGWPNPADDWEDAATELLWTDVNPEVGLNTRSSLYVPV